MRPLTVLFLFLVLVAFAQPAYGCGTPAYSPSDLNEDKILEEEHWNLFQEIDGFNNTPSAEKRWGSPLSFHWDDTAGQLYFVVLETDEFYSEVHFSKFSNVTVEEFNVSVNATSSNPIEFPSYLMTVHIDENDEVHVIWEGFTEDCDIPN